MAFDRKSIPDSDKYPMKPAFEQRYREILGEHFDEFVKWSYSYLRKSIRINTIKTDVEPIVARLREQGFILEQIPWCKEGFYIEHITGRRDIGCTIEHAIGYYYIQEAASMIPPVVLDPQEDEVVLDMCASPGSKSTQLAQYMHNTGILVSNDLTTKRIAPLSINLQRCGAYNSLITISHGAGWKRLPLEFDRILVDAPCSGVGAMRKSLKTMLMWNPAMITRLSMTQKALIESAYSKLKEGGTLVYSTCTLEPEENEGVINHLLKLHPEAKAMDISLDIKKGKPVTHFAGTDYDPSVKKTMRLYPQDNDTEGFFIAKIKKGR